ncbi:MAG: deoxyribose-phosphate aldolase [Lachnospiraceae bacterium]|nr:deoxyribose-phosphate aldolase [Lachnospiraceae bacterium]
MLSPKLFDHTILKADASEASVKKICDEAREYDFMSVCVNSFYTAYVAQQLKDSDVKVCSVIGFPLGQMSTAAKVAETEDVVANGADEVDMVLNVAALKDQKYDFVKEDIRSVKAACQGKLLKVILETCLLTKDEIVKACELSEEAGADYVKTSTGFSTGGATVENVALMRATVGDRLGVKASGGIRDTATAEAMVAAGASRIGASATISILSGIQL